MADTPAAGSIKNRIASLNLEEVHTVKPGERPAYMYERADGGLGKKKAPPPPPPGHRPQRQQSAPAPVNARAEVGNEPAAAPKLPPRLPPRRPTGLENGDESKKEAGPPSLPPRKSSEYSIKRQASNESISTIASGMSARSVGSTRTTASAGGTLYRVRAPEYDPTKLPPLPPKVKNQDEGKSATLKAMRSKTDVVPNRVPAPQLPSRPPLPARKDTKGQGNMIHEDEPPKPALKRLPPPVKKSALELGLNKSTESSPPLPSTRPDRSVTPDPGAPPPIPLSSRPNLSAIMASKPKPGATGFCLKCRNFSAPDAHAANFPRQNLPSSDVGWLAHQLCSPFPSLTDKARAIFTWLHHNIDYDTVALFSGKLYPSTPAGTITSGLAVCEGYAGLFSALALKAGLEAVVVTGHGMGYGLEPLKPGQPIPPFNGNHAWNAVRIDHGEWKLIDPCWGAGHLGANRSYTRQFAPEMFTMDNNDFGRKHFPEDQASCFRTDGRASVPWEEYITGGGMGERLQIYSSCIPDHGIDEETFQPALKHIRVNDPQSPVVRFQFGSVCQHWDNERHGKGKPYVMVLHVGGRDGRKSDHIPFNTDDRSYWLDVKRVDLGCPGQKVSVYAVTNVEGKDARGMSPAEYEKIKGRKAHGFGGLAMYELV